MTEKTGGAMLNEVEYSICQLACLEEGCFCPAKELFLRTIANTPVFVRAYYERKGRISEKEG